MFHKILLCSDGSDCALDAARVGAVLARHLGAEVLALQICEAPMPILTQAGPGSMLLGKAVSDQYVTKQAQLHQERMQSLFAEADVCCQVLQETGHPVEGIVRVAERETADLIVLGSRGLHGIKEFFLGSVSSGVLHHAPCSVLIVRGENAPCATQEFQRILLVSDGSEGADKAGKAAVEFAQKFSTSLTVLNVVEPFSNLPLLPDEDYGLISDVDPEVVTTRLLELVRRNTLSSAKEAGVYCGFHQEKGAAEETIIRFANQQRADLIVMGSRGLGGFGRMLLGSVSNYVAHHANCPVLIVR